MPGITKTFIAAAALAVALGLSAPAHAEDAGAVAAVNEAAEALDKAFERQDAKAIEALVTAEHLAVTPYYDAPVTAKEQIASLPELKYDQTNLDAPKVTLLGEDVALRTFSAELKGTYKGKRIPSPAFISSILVKGADGKLARAFLPGHTDLGAIAAQLPSGSVRMMPAGTPAAMVFFAAVLTKVPAPQMKTWRGGAGRRCSAALIVPASRRRP